MKLHLQKISQIVTTNPQLSVAQYDRELEYEGFTGGYWPLAGYHKSLKECLEERIPNILFLKYGGIEELCIGGQIQTHEGHLIDLKKTPRSATGPDFRKLIIGSKGVIGHFEEVSLKVFPLPDAWLWGLLLFKESWEPAQALKTMLGLFIRPLFARILNEEESSGVLHSLNLLPQEGVLLALKFAGLKSLLEATKEVIDQKIARILVSYWPRRTAETEILDKMLVTPEGFQNLIQAMNPFFGPHPSEWIKAETKLLSYLRENPC